MNEIIRRLKMCADLLLRGSDMILIDREMLDFYEAEVEWNDMWFFLAMQPFMETESDSFQGLSDLVCKNED